MSDVPKEWTEPQEPFLTQCPGCRADIHPDRVQMEVNTPNYTGPLVVLGYRDTGDNVKIAINGRVFSREKTEAMYDYATELLTEAYVDYILKDAFKILAVNAHV